MTIDTKDMLNSILSSISRIDYVRPDDIPNIDLYMDQVTTFMEKELASSKRHEDDKILTKTMINNYAKNNLLPPPVKKKYSKEHLLVMIFIYYFKNFLSIKDIETMLTPITDNTSIPTKILISLLFIKKYVNWKNHGFRNSKKKSSVPIILQKNALSRSRKMTEILFSYLHSSVI